MRRRISNFVIRICASFLSCLRMSFVVPGGTVASRRPKGIDTPPPAGLTLVNSLALLRLWPCRLQVITLR